MKKRRPRRSSDDDKMTQEFISLLILTVQQDGTKFLTLAEQIKLFITTVFSKLTNVLPWENNPHMDYK